MNILSLFRCSVPLMLLVLGACSIGGTAVPADHFYRLPNPDVKPLASPTFDKIIIRPVQVEGLYHERAILYVEQDRPLELRRYRYHFWVQPPAAMLRQYMKNWLRQSALAAEVVTDIRSELMAAAANQQSLLEITPVISAFERHITGQGMDSRLALEFRLVYPQSSQAPRSLEYRVSVASAGPAMHDTAEAFGQALDQVMNRLVADLQK